MSEERIRVFSIITAVVLAAVGTLAAVSPGLGAEEAISRSFTVLNRPQDSQSSSEAISRSFTVLNRPVHLPEPKEAISRAFTVINLGAGGATGSEAISRTFTVLNRPVPTPEQGEALSRSFTVLNVGAPLCGDGLVTGMEECDDGDTVGGDGCSATCMQEPGWMCTGEPSICTSVVGACCDHDPFGACTDGVTLAACDCPTCEWVQQGSCSELDCQHATIPTVGEWGLIVLALLLLTGAKLASRRPNPADPGGG